MVRRDGNRDSKRWQLWFEEMVIRVRRPTYLPIPGPQSSSSLAVVVANGWSIFTCITDVDHAPQIQKHLHMRVLLTLIFICHLQ